MFGRRNEGEKIITSYIPPALPAVVKSGAKLEFVNPEGLFDSIKANKNGTLINQPALAPLEQVKIVYDNDRGRLDMSCYLTFSDVAKEHIVRVIDRVINKYSYNRRVLGGNTLVRRDQQREFVYRQLFWTENKKSLIGIYTGKGFDIDGKKIQLIESPLLDPQSFASTLADIKQLVEYSIDEAHLAVNGSIEPEQFIVNLPISNKIEPVDLKYLARSLKLPEELAGKISIERPDLTFDDIGGQKEAKARMQNLVDSLKHPEVYKRWGTKTPKGILLYGPPGTGKTLLAKALASQIDAVFLHVESSDVLMKWYGESENLLKGVFELAKSTEQSTIIFFDEIDALAPNRANLKGENVTTQRMVSTLLENLDGLGSNDNTTVVAATNRLSALDPAIVRSGRFDIKINVPDPDEESRREIFEIKFRQAEKIAERVLTEGLDYGKLARITEGFNGADIAEIVRRTLEEKAQFEAHGVDPGLVVNLDVLGLINRYETDKQLTDN